LNVFALGAGDRLVGRTRYCVEPQGRVERIAEVGGTKDADADAVGRLQPDLILANQEENTKAQIEELARRGFPVYIAFPKTVAEGINHLAKLARLFGVERDPAVHELLRRGLHAVAGAQ